MRSLRCQSVLKKISISLAVFFAAILFLPSVSFAQVFSPPSTIPVASVDQITVTDVSASIGGTLTNGQYLPEVEIMYGTTSTNLNGQAIALATDTYFAANLTLLDPNTKYYYDVVGPGYGGKSSPIVLTSVSSFTTNLTATATPFYTSAGNAAASLFTTNLTQDSVTIAGTVSAGVTPEVFVDTDGSGTYGYHTSPSVGANGLFTFNLTGLQPDHIYSMYAARSDNPTILLTGLCTFATLAVTASPYVISVTDTTAQIGVKMSAGAQSPVIKYGTSSGSLTQQASLSSGSNGVYTANLTGLKASTAYSYEVAGTSNGIATTYTNPYSFLTAPAKVTAPTVSTIVDSTTAASSVTSSNTFTLTSLVQCGSSGPLVTPNTTTYNPNGVQACGFPQLIQLISRLIDFLLFLVAPIILTGVLVWAGILILTSGGSVEKFRQARGMVTKAIIGMVIAMAAWIIVKFILVNLQIDPTVFPTFY